MTLRKIIISAVCAFFVGHVAAQPKMTVASEVANLGEIMFQLPAKVNFKIKNTGTEPLRIQEVIPSCGCTAVEWTKELIGAGAEGTITAIYDAKMLGVFQKDLEVYTNASEEPVYLHLQGRVVTKLSDYSNSFPYEMGDIRLNVNNIEFDNVNRGDKPVAEIQLVNLSRKSYHPQLMHLPPYLTAQYYPEVLSGGRMGKVLLTLDSEKLMQMGLTQTSIYLARRPGDKVGEDNEITVSSVLLPDFSSLSVDERAKAPEMVLSADTLDLGEMGRKRKLSGEIEIRNTGKTNLEIKSLQVFNNAVSLSLSDRIIAPGKSEVLKITITAKYLKKVKNRPRVLLITNDPAHSKEIITVKVKL